MDNPNKKMPKKSSSKSAGEKKADAQTKHLDEESLASYKVSHVFYTNLTLRDLIPFKLSQKSCKLKTSLDATWYLSSYGIKLHLGIQMP